MIGIIYYGMGNILSVKNAIEFLGEDVTICLTPQSLLECDKYILPGVGAFGDCIRNLYQHKFVNELNLQVIENKKPILGICLGMQAMAKKSYEGGEYEGLGWFDAEVVKIETNNKKLKVPHVGWNELDYNTNHPLFAGLPKISEFYFVHSYYMSCINKEDIIATCSYGIDVTAAVCKENIVATQFHPEKSQDYGLRFLENFVEWNP